MILSTTFLNTETLLWFLIINLVLFNFIFIILCKKFLIFLWGLGFGVWGLGFGVWGLGFGVWGLGANFQQVAKHLNPSFLVWNVASYPERYFTELNSTCRKIKPQEEKKPKTTSKRLQDRLQKTANTSSAQPKVEVNTRRSGAESLRTDQLGYAIPEKNRQGISVHSAAKWLQ